METYESKHDDKAGRIEWLRTSTINIYTDEPNYLFDTGIVHAVVFRRKYGWAFTVRHELDRHRWIQVSSNTITYYCNEEFAKLDAIKAIEDLSKMLGQIWQG